MSVSTRTIGSALAEVTGSASVSEGPDAVRQGLVDGISPRWVVAPASSEQVARVLALAHGEGLVVVPRGGGSALAMGAPMDRLDIVLDTRNLTRVLDYTPDDLTVSVEAGLTAQALAGRLAERRQWLPVDPPGVQSRTLGGLIATNAFGPLRVRYGTLRDLLLGVRFVQADGVITWGGARVVKSVTGYDVPKLMVGSLGTLGVLTELTLRLHPRPETEGTWLATFPSADAAQIFVGLVLDSTLQPNRVELLNAAALSACAASAAPAAVAVGIGSVEAAVREQGADLVSLAQRAGGGVTPTATTFWDRFDQAIARASRSRDAVVLQIGTLPSRLAETAEAIARGPASIVTGCATLGILHVVLDGTSAGEAATAIARLRDSVAGFGGSVIVRAAPRAVRAAVDPWGPVAPAALAVMQRLKQEFDPRRILNPGRFVGGI
jgi:glycolate dehydrogenase FAD-binding subunit